MKIPLHIYIILALSFCSLKAASQIEFYINDSTIEIGNSYTVYILESSDTVYTSEGKIPSEFYKFNDDTSDVTMLFEYNGINLKFIISSSAVECIKLISNFSINYYIDASDSWFEYMHSRNFAIMTCICCNLSFVYNLERE